MKPVQKSIEAALTAQFSPVHMVVDNESHMHSVPPESETHFKITLVSPAFVGKRQVQRHQAVYAVLAEQMAGPVHALALHTFAPDEWRSEAVPESPNCLGGGRH
ncbi:BolA family protein [Gilvimarinus algae]|uniref:BolA/IbaG family iron-sulfur metabolism protein n=1 Tax=Gilvimarinus algae TaxID=3058037 RepID=A0ABT8TKV8_9GAMM|nr:BolA/IbaG family iron-sulfur metabolism protein [Gilvimarinus sp. SDUM040014]MDO3382977.1 BolA/IbaG family iron-sulfur metabolism protein [Gilvimarinus sp. SDUM040014]